MSADAATLLARLEPGLAGAALAPLTATVMSPIHRAVENDLWRVTPATGPEAVLRVLRPDMRDDFDAEAMVAGALAAAEAGAGPRVLAADAAAGALLLEHLGAGWRTATLWDLRDGAIRGAIVAATRRLHETPAVAPRFDPFARLRDGVVRARARDVALPADLDWLLDGAAQVEDAVAAAPAAPALCRNDGASTNVMVRADGRVLLLDHDRAGMNDPAYDLGVLMAEAADFDDEAMDWVRAWGDGPGLFDRGRLYGAVDDLLWAVFAATQGTVSERIHLEFSKYSQWRFMRARRILADRRFEERVRHVRGGLA